MNIGKYNYFNLYYRTIKKINIFLNNFPTIVKFITGEQYEITN